MNFVSATVLLAAILVLGSVTNAARPKEKFNVALANSLAKEAKKTALFTRGNQKTRQDNEAILAEATELVRTVYSECRPNVCFVMDSSSNLTPTQHSIEKSFVTLAAATIGGLPGCKLGAVQYGGNPTSPITSSPDLWDAATMGAQFLTTVSAAPHLNSNPAIVWPALDFCINAFGNDPAAVNKIVILGDGQSTFQGSTAISTAVAFEAADPGNSVCAGIIGKGSKQFFLDIVSGKKKKVMRKKNWTRIIDMIFELVDNICG